MDTLTPDGRALIRQKAAGYLIRHIGNLASPGTPQYQPERDEWVVPIRCHAEQGLLAVGQLTLDRDANVIDAPTREELCERARQLKSRTPVLVYGDPQKLREAGFEVITA
jgi:hypothetical protein